MLSILILLGAALLLIAIAAAAKQGRVADEVPKREAPALPGMTDGRTCRYRFSKNFPHLIPHSTVRQ